MEQQTQTPYIEVLQNELKDHHAYFEMLTKRIALIKANNGYTEKSEFEKNEIEITIVETRGKIAALKKLITQREEYYKQYSVQYAKDLEDCDKNFDKIVELAKAKAPKNKILDEELKVINWDNVAKMPEVKVTLYKRLKQLAQ